MTSQNTDGSNATNASPRPTPNSPTTGDPRAGNREPSMRKTIEETAQPIGSASGIVQPSGPVAPTPPEAGEVRNGDRGDASGRNLAQSRAIGQDPPTEGSRQGREANKKAGYPGTPDIGTDAAQREGAERFNRGKAD